MSARTDEEKRLVAHIKGKSPRNRERRSGIIRAHRESLERVRRAQMESKEYREGLNRKQAIFDEFFTAKAHKNLASTPDNSGKKTGNDCEFCANFREVNTKICPNCGKPLN